MDSDPKLLKIIQRYFLLFSASVFAISALLLLTGSDFTFHAVLDNAPAIA